MRYRNSLLVLGVAVIGIFLGRAQLLPYMPASVAKALSMNDADDDPRVDAGQQKNAAGRRGAHAVTVTVATAKTGSLPVRRNAVGVVVPYASTALSSLVSGIVAEIRVKDGADVKAGDLLVQLDDRTINANIQRDTAALAKDQAALDEANVDLKRVETLSNAGAETQQQYDDAVAASKQAQAAVAVDQANLTGDRVELTQTQIRAPFDGKLGVIQLSVGAYVAPGAAIVTLTQMKPVYAEFALPETDLDLVRSALASGTLGVHIAPTLSRNREATITGPIVFIDNAVDTASGTFKLRASLDNADNALWPGQALDVTVDAGQKEGVVIVPAVAVQPQDGGSVCYVVGNDKTVKLRKVEVAFGVGDMVGLKAGLKAGEIVVTEGQAGLVDGAHVSEAVAPAADPAKIAEGTPDTGAAQ